MSTASIFVSSVQKEVVKIAHRDYVSNASMQVMLFEDRLEVRNPGELQPPLTVERLRRPHPSIPHHLLVAEPLLQALGLKDDEHFRKAYRQPALEAGPIEMTIPDKPRSSKHRYRLTPKGVEASRKR